MFSITNYIYLFIILVVLLFFYRRFEDKRIQQEDTENYNMIRNYLLNDNDLAEIKKPILWIHIPYEYNARNWMSFGSRSSFELNQPYLYLCVKSIIEHCKDSFHICLIDDHSFDKLIPNWNIQVSDMAEPISNKLRMLALLHLLREYGGLIVPISFTCFQNLLPFYENALSGNKMVIVENIDRNSTSTYVKFYPDPTFIGAPKGLETTNMLINQVQSVVSQDFTSRSSFLGDFSRFCNEQVKQGNMYLLDGKYIGVKGTDGKPIGIEELLGQNKIDLLPNAYGIYIPAKEILKRRNYEWFARLSDKQVLESNTTLAKYLLLANAPDKKGILVESMEKRDTKWVGFWKVASDAPVWGMRPLNQGDENVLSLAYPNN